MSHIARHLPHRQVGRNGIEVCAPPRVFARMKYLPYGAWRCRDGREVLFNRFYQPIWQRRPGGPVEEADLNQWISGIVSERHYYTDATADKERAARRALREWMGK